MSASSSSQPIDELELLNWGTKIGAAARSENVRPTQLENLIASLDSVSGREALLATAIFALRQAQRLGDTGQPISSAERLSIYTREEPARTMRGRCSVLPSGFTRLTSPTGTGSSS